MSIFDRVKNLGRAAGLPWMPPEERARPLDPVVLPQDERPHDRLIEWWHFIGQFKVIPRPDRDNLAADPLAEPETTYSFVVSILKGRVLGLDQIGSVVVLTDEKDLSRVVTSRAVAAGSASFDPNDGRCFFFQFGAGASRPGAPHGWRVSGGMGAYAIDLDTQRQVSLRLTQRTPANLIGDKGRERYDDGPELAYCVWPRLDVRGTIGTGLQSRLIAGKAWMEHQYGDVRVGDYHWKFIPLMYGNKRYSFFKVGGGSFRPNTEVRPRSATIGYRLDESGEAVDLIEPKLETLSGFHRGYPLATTVSFSDPTGEIKDGKRVGVPRAFQLDPLFDDQFLDYAISPAFFPEFWEGVCKVKVLEGEIPGAEAWALTELAGLRRSTR